MFHKITYSTIFIDTLVFMTFKYLCSIYDDLYLEKNVYALISNKCMVKYDLQSDLYSNITTIYY